MNVNIHRYKGTRAHLDDEGEPKHGYYFEFLNGLDQPISPQTGPYKTRREAKNAAQLALDNNDFVRIRPDLIPH